MVCAMWHLGFATLQDCVKPVHLVILAQVNPRVSHATPTALTAITFFVEARSSAVDRITIEALSDVHVPEIAESLPSATVGALGEHVEVDQAHVCV